MSSIATGQARQLTHTVRWRFAAMVATVAIMAGFLAIYCAILVLSPPQIWGDGPEYGLMLQSWYDHASPDLRAEDLARGAVAFSRQPAEPNVGQVGGYYLTRDGAYYSYHFWFYSLSALPVLATRTALGLGGAGTLQITNALWFCGALVVVARTTVLSMRRRLAFIALAAVSPVLWYLIWTGPEVQAWACVMMALALSTQRRYALAALCAVLAAWQNPPLLCLVGVIALIALTTRDRRVILTTAPIAALGLVPNLYTMILFGTPNLIASVGMADPRLASVWRTWSLVTDLNQGMLPYVPLLLVLSALAWIMALRMRRQVALLVGGSLVPIAFLSEATTNWNSGCLGLIRYAVWMVPILAWLVATQLPPARWAMFAIGAAVLTQLAILFTPGMFGGHDAQMPLARLILDHAPVLYNPEPEIFVERQEGVEGTDPRNVVPLAYTAPDGRVTKLLMDTASIDRLREGYSVDTDYLARLHAEHNAPKGLFYINPPLGTIRALTLDTRIDR